MSDRRNCLDDDTLEDVEWNDIDEIIKLNISTKEELEKDEDKLICKYKYFYKIIR